MKKGKKTADRKPAADLSLEAKIRRLAFKLYEERGCEDGNDMRDWLKAEQLLSNPRVMPSECSPEAPPSKSRPR